MIEEVIVITMPIFDFFAQHSSFGMVFSALLIFLNWFIFHFHETKIMEYDYYMENIHFTAYFSSPTYNLYKGMAMMFPPASLFVIVYSVATLLNTEMFMNTFSIKGKFNVFTIIKKRSSRKFTKSPTPLKKKG